mmetsp:Transcript_8089/g.16872  ORF Transcript_8089/g.16872 Transcript_8089/m.16872 type:complete len:250 (+) Transcript_8089:1047-1796(+)
MKSSILRTPRCMDGVNLDGVVEAREGVYLYLEGVAALVDLPGVVARMRFFLALLATEAGALPGVVGGRVDALFCLGTAGLRGVFPAIRLLAVEGVGLVLTCAFDVDASRPTERVALLARPGVDVTALDALVREKGASPFTTTTTSESPAVGRGFAIAVAFIRSLIDVRVEEADAVAAFFFGTALPFVLRDLSDVDLTAPTLGELPLSRPVRTIISIRPPSSHSASASAFAPLSRFVSLESIRDKRSSAM